ncbi:restriction endonuclease [Candidatus Nomurabacteria bacterium]|nr:restriction endonuclease [Candidatus Nomurabacteria bacterium]
MSDTSENSAKPHVPVYTIAMTMVFAFFVTALGFLILGSGFGRVLGIIIVLVIVVSVAITLVLFHKKKSLDRIQEEEKIRAHRERMQKISKEIIAAGTLMPLQELDQRTLNHFVAFVLSQWGYRADVPTQIPNQPPLPHVWLYQGAQQFATYIDTDSKPISEFALQNFASRYLGRSSIRGVYITLGSFSSEAQAWATQFQPVLWLIDAQELLSIIQRTDRKIVDWNAGPYTPLA